MKSSISRIARVLGLALLLAACSSTPTPPVVTVTQIPSPSLYGRPLPPLDISPTQSTFSVDIKSAQSVSGKILAIAVAPSDNTRLYAGAYSGVWRSDDAGAHWRQMTRPQPPEGTYAVPGALAVPTVTSIAVSPSNRDVILVSTNADTRVSSRGGVYQSTDGGQSWALTQPIVINQVGQVTFAPDDSNLAYAALGTAVAVSHNAGLTWRLCSLTAGGSAWHIVVAPQETTGGVSLRRVYAVGPNWLGYSTDGGCTWTADPGVAMGTSPPSLPPGGSWPNGVPPTPSFGEAPDDDPHSFGKANDQVLAVEPGHPDHVYLATYDGANGPAFFFPGSPATDGLLCNSPSTPTSSGGPPCGRGGLWLGDFSSFASISKGTWTHLPSPASYAGGGITHSAGVSVLTEPTATGYTLLFIDGDVNVTNGRPTTSASWHRIDGPNASDDKQLGLTSDSEYIHWDFHGIAVSSDFAVRLTAPPSSVPPPYNQNSVLSAPGHGHLWIADDGGVHITADGGVHFSLGAGLSTLAPINVAGIPATSTGGPLLMIGMGDNADFASLNGGAMWEHPYTECGDCASNFADPLQLNQLLSYDWGNPAYFELFTASSSTSYPAPKYSSEAILFPCPPAGIPPTGMPPQPGNCVGYTSATLGSRPIVLTLAGQAPAAHGDYLAFGIDVSTGGKALMRMLTASSATTPGSWVPPAPDLPAAAANVDVVQASGGHTTPTFYVGDPDSKGTLWKSTASGWVQIVPSATASHAWRFFVDPYNPKLIYIRDDSAIKQSDNGGTTWTVDTALNNALTENKVFSYNGRFLTHTVMQDLIFVPSEPNTRFAVGVAGIFSTTDGSTWHRLLDTTAIPCYPEAVFFDFRQRLLYVATDGRGLLRFGPLA